MINERRSAIKPVPLKEYNFFCCNVCRNGIKKCTKFLKCNLCNNYICQNCDYIYCNKCDTKLDHYYTVKEPSSNYSDFVIDKKKIKKWCCM